MFHKHPVYDTDLHLIIDPITREVDNTSGKVVMMQHDHNSERFTFEIPRYVDGHDMSVCNVVEFHYINIEATGEKRESKDVYPVDDLQVSPDDENFVIGSWLVSQNATAYEGSLNVIIRFACISDLTSRITYQWFTNVYSGLKVYKGIYNTEVVTNEGDPDTLAAWKKEIFEMVGTYAGDAKLYARAAELSANSASDSAENAAKSATDAANSASWAKQYAEDAALSADNAATSEANAKTSEENAARSAEGIDECLEQTKAIKDESLELLEQAKKTVMGVEYKIENTIFVANTDTGCIECFSPNYTFTINEETGNMEGEVSEMGNTIESFVEEKVDAGLQYVTDSVDEANAAVTELKKSFETYIGEGDAYEEIQNGISDLNNTKANKSVVSNSAVSESNWTGNAAPYIYELEVEGVTEDNLIEVIASPSSTDEQIVAFMDAKISKITQSENLLTLYAYGDKPTIELSIVVIVRGDV